MGRKAKAAFLLGENEMREIELTRGMKTLVDDEDYQALVDFGKWQAMKTKIPGLFYAMRKGPGTRKHRPAIFMHRMIMGCHPSNQVDHIDGDGLHNCKSNLRLATLTENHRNARKRVGTTSIYKGVCYQRNNRGSWGSWLSAIKVNGTRIKLGYFKDEIDAALAYDKAARIYFGSFATFNFPEIGERSCL